MKNILILRESKRLYASKDKKRQGTVYRLRAHKVTQSMNKLV